MVKYFILHITAATTMYVKCGLRLHRAPLAFGLHCLRKETADNELPGVLAFCQLWVPQDPWTTVNKNPSKLLAFSHFPYEMAQLGIIYFLFVLFHKQFFK